MASLTILNFCNRKQRLRISTSRNSFLLTCPISQSVSLHQAGKACRGQRIQLIGPICQFIEIRYFDSSAPTISIKKIKLTLFQIGGAFPNELLLSRFKNLATQNNQEALELTLKSGVNDIKLFLLIRNGCSGRISQSVSDL